MSSRDHWKAQYRCNNAPPYFQLFYCFYFFYHFSNHPVRVLFAFATLFIFWNFVMCIHIVYFCFFLLFPPYWGVIMCPNLLLFILPYFALYCLIFRVCCCLLYHSHQSIFPTIVLFSLLICLFSYILISPLSVFVAYAVVFAVVFLSAFVVWGVAHKYIPSLYKYIF